MSPLRQVGVLVLVAAVAAGAWIAWSGSLFGTTGVESGVGEVAKAPATAAPVVVAPVRLQGDGAVIEAVGTGIARQAVELHPEAAGRIVELAFEAGDRVEPGALLLRLDDEEERLALDLARVNVADAEQRLARYEQAAPSGAVSQSEVDVARTALQAARIERQRAELALERRSLVAPFGGVIGISEVDVGDRVDETTPVATLDDRSALLVAFEVPEAFAGSLAEGDTVGATTWARPGERFEGTVVEVASRLDPATRTLTVRASLPNDDDLLRPGMAFAIGLQLAGGRFPTVPSIAVQWDSEGAHVWLIADGTAERMPVKIVKRGDGVVLIDAALDENDAVVVEGMQRLRPGTAVEVVAADADG